MRIVTWNVNGYRGIWKKNFEENIRQIKPDILCLQETKLNEIVLMKKLSGYTSYWNHSKEPGTAGTVIQIRDGMRCEKNQIHITGRMQMVLSNGICYINIYAPAQTSQLKRTRQRYDFFQNLTRLVRKYIRYTPVCI